MLACLQSRERWSEQEGAGEGTQICKHSTFWLDFASGEGMMGEEDPEIGFSA